MGYDNGGHSAAPPEVGLSNSTHGNPKAHTWPCIAYDTRYPMLWQLRLDHFRGTVCSVARHFEKVMVGACRDFVRDSYQNLTDVEVRSDSREKL